MSRSASNWWRSVLIWSAPGCIPLQLPQRASVSFARHSRRSSCARTAQSSMRSCTGKCGDHTQLQVKQRLNAAGRHNPRIPDDTIALVRELARLMPDRQIARLLNRTRVETGHGNAWTQERVRGFRNHHDIAVFRDGEWAERGEITLEAAAKLISVCNMTALRMLRRGDLKGRQACAGAPWVIKAEDVAAFVARKRSTAPVKPNPDQQTFGFQ